MVDAQRLGRLAFTHYHPTSVCPQAYLYPYLAAPNAVGPPPRPTAPPPRTHMHTSMGQTIVTRAAGNIRGFSSPVNQHFEPICSSAFNI